MKSLSIVLKNVTCYKTPTKDLYLKLSGETVALNDLVSSSFPKDTENYKEFAVNIEIKVDIPEEDITINSNYDFEEDVTNEGQLSEGNKKEN